MIPFELLRRNRAYRFVCGEQGEIASPSRPVWHAAQERKVLVSIHLSVGVPPGLAGTLADACVLQEQ